MISTLVECPVCKIKKRFRLENKDHTSLTRCKNCFRGIVVQFDKLYKTGFHASTIINLVGGAYAEIQKSENNY